MKRIIDRITSKQGTKEQIPVSTASDFVITPFLPALAALLAEWIPDISPVRRQTIKRSPALICAFSSVSETDILSAMLLI